MHSRAFHAVDVLTTKCPPHQQQQAACKLPAAGRPCDVMQCIPGKGAGALTPARARSLRRRPSLRTSPRHAARNHAKPQARAYAAELIGICPVEVDYAKQNCRQPVHSASAVGCSLGRIKPPGTLATCPCMGSCFLSAQRAPTPSKSTEEAKQWVCIAYWTAAPASLHNYRSVLVPLSHAQF